MLTYTIATGIEVFVGRKIPYVRTNGSLIGYSSRIIPNRDAGNEQLAVESLIFGRIGLTGSSHRK